MDVQDAQLFDDSCYSETTPDCQILVNGVWENSWEIEEEYYEDQFRNHRNFDDDEQYIPDSDDEYGEYDEGEHIEHLNYTQAQIEEDVNYNITCKMFEHLENIKDKEVINYEKIEEIEGLIQTMMKLLSSASFVDECNLDVGVSKEDFKNYCNDLTLVRLIKICNNEIKKLNSIKVAVKNYE